MVDYALAGLKNHKVGQTTFDAALNQLGTQALTELTTLLGYYSLLALNANAFEIDVPAQGTETRLPI